MPVTTCDAVVVGAGPNGLVAAAEYNPVVFPLALGLAALTLRVLRGVTAGIWYDVRLPRQMRWPLFAAFVVALVLLGIRQEMHAAILVQPWTGG